MEPSSENLSSSKISLDSFLDGKNPSSSEGMPSEINIRPLTSKSTNPVLSQSFSREKMASRPRWMFTSTRVKAVWVWECTTPIKALKSSLTVPSNTR